MNVKSKNAELSYFKILSGLIICKHFTKTYLATIFWGSLAPIFATPQLFIFLLAWVIFLLKFTTCKLGWEFSRFGDILTWFIKLLSFLFIWVLGIDSSISFGCTDTEWGTFFISISRSHFNNWYGFI